ncbi:hypothetical protein LSM04_008277 [Trypanosoma melophagium]|uniref:uncharacterized protein n=1 Tax=Trypanosoma melophagium TaxID=715481 RepID=UPI00351AAECA|nr:hypothetical protein LSM04_008277 [Trypanosoma melophagium]
MNPESELQAKYDAAVKDWKAAKKAREAAEREKDKRLKLAEQQPDGCREYYIARTKSWKAEIAFLEQCEQEWALECKKCEIAVNLMVHRHSVDSKAAQIARHRLELTHTKEFAFGVFSPYWTRWEKLDDKVWLLYYQLKVEGRDAAADEINRARYEFCTHISNESNGKVFHEAWDMATAALDKWEETNDRSDWDAAKPKYDTELEKWNAFKPKGDEYAKALESKINECIQTFPMAHFFNELSQTRIQKLEDENKQKTKELNQLKNEIKELGDEVEQRVKKIQEVEDTVREKGECINSLAQGIQTLIRAHCQYIAESEATARTAVEQEWQMWFEHTMAERRTLEKSEAASRHQNEQEWQMI